MKSFDYSWSIITSFFFGNLLPKLFWPKMRKKISSDREKLLKFKAEGWEFAKNLKSREQFIQTDQVRTISGNRMLFSLVPGGFSDLKK